MQTPQGHTLVNPIWIYWQCHLFHSIHNWYHICQIAINGSNNNITLFINGLISLYKHLQCVFSIHHRIEHHLLASIAHSSWYHMDLWTCKTNPLKWSIVWYCLYDDSIIPCSLRTYCEKMKSNKGKYPTKWNDKFAASKMAKNHNYVKSDIVSVSISCSIAALPK